jgi:hypothetical protein
MKAALTTFIQKIKTNSNLLSLGELAAKSGIIEPVLRLLGWDTSIAASEVTLEYQVENRRVDYCLHPTKSNLVFLEAKKPAEDLEDQQILEQLLDYAFRQGVKLAVLSSGVTWSFYLPLTEGKWENRRFYTVDLIEQDSSEAASRLIDFLSRENVASGDGVRNAEKLLEGIRRQEIIADSIPDAWNRIVSEPNSLLLELIAERTNKICGFQPSPDDLSDFFRRNTDRFLLSPEDDTPDAPIPSVSRPKIGAREGIPILESDKVSVRQLTIEIVRALQSLGGRAAKEKVEEIIFKKYERVFSLPYYQQPVSWGIPRWQHNIAWAKEDAKKRGLVKWPSESGRGTWELTPAGRTFKS